MDSIQFKLLFQDSGAEENVCPLQNFKGQDLLFKFQFFLPGLAFNFCISTEFVLGINRNWDVAYGESCTVYCKDIVSQHLVNVNELET